MALMRQIKFSMINLAKLKEFSGTMLAGNIPKFKIIHRNCTTQLQKDNLEKHKRNVMAKGLPKVKPIQGVKHIIVVASGKGGVGKSTTAVNLAASLKLLQPDKNVGLLDVDVFGPSIPLMMNLHETPLLTKDNFMEPLTNYGVKCMSMGFLIEEGAPIIWRGLMVMQALEKLLRQVYWGSVEYLVVDTPPGTGDTHLSLIQNIPISGVILVTTPQSAAIQVTKRGAVMFQKLNVPIIGIVENMSSVICPACSADVQLFGNGTVGLATDIGTTILQQIPIRGDISSSTDKGIPIVIDKSNSDEATAYKNIAKKVIEFLSNVK